MSQWLRLNRQSSLCLLCGVSVLLSPSVFGARSTFQADPEYLIDTWETEDGLPENSATAMVQTADGYLWFGTFNGLVRFDGVKFTVLDPANTSQLPSAGIVNLHLDRRGWLWVSTYEGLVVRRNGSGAWRPFGAKDGWAGNYVRSFAERQNGDLLLTTFDGHVLEFVDDRLLELPSPGGKQGYGYLAQIDDSNRWKVVQQWFAGSWDGRQWIPDLSSTNLFSRIYGAGNRGDDKSWLIAGGKVITYRQGKAVSASELPDGFGNSWDITEDSQRNLWIATYDQGLFRMTPAGEWRHWSMTNGLSYDSTRFVFEDRENNLWVGTSGGGLQRFKPRRFQSFGLQQGLPERVVRCVAPAADGSMLIATYGKGLCKLNGGVVETLQLPRRDAYFTYTQSVLTDRIGRLWVATFGQSAWMADTNGFHLIGAECTGGHNVFALFEDSRGRVWMASTARVAVSDRDMVRLLPDRHEFAGVRCFGEDRQGVIWLASPDGVFRLENDCPVQVQNGARPLRDISCLKTDPDGTIWLGSLSSGLYYWRDGLLKAIGSEVGLPVTAVNGILEDRLGYFWLTSNRGVGRVRRSDLLAVVEGISAQVRGESFDSTDGLPSVECAGGQQPTCAADAAGRLWFATSKGVAMVDPGRLRLNTLPPPTQIESIQYQAAAHGNRPRAAVERHVEAPFLESLRLPAGTKRLRIRYTAPSFVAPEKVRFQVKLAGRDRDWRDEGSSRMVDFDELPPGKYEFRVRAANNDGIWNEAGSSLALVVEPFIWQTTWFRLGFVFCLFSTGGVTAGWQLRLRHRREVEELQRSRRQQAELAHVARVSTMGELASSVAHELNQPLGAILSNAEAAELFLNQSPPALEEVRGILADIRKDDERAGEVIRRMRTLLRKREMEMVPIDLNSVVEDVFRFVSADASLRRTAMHADLSHRPVHILGDRVHLQQVLLNLMLNAMEAMNKQPPEKRHATVRTGIGGDGWVEMSVTDSGCGIDPDKLPHVFEPFFTTKTNGMGMGLSIARRIIEAHHGRIWAQNNASGGATFSVLLPAASGTGAAQTPPS